MICKNCNNPIENIKLKGKPEYVHICYKLHSPNQCRQSTMHIADKDCYSNICNKAEPLA